jgi:putative DNA primase/helicase
MTNEIRTESDIDLFVRKFHESEHPREIPNLLPYLHNDHGNAERLIAMYGEGLRYCHAFRKWLVWDGRRWALDDTGQARRAAKMTMLEFLKQAISSSADDKPEKFARRSLEDRRINSMLSMADCEIYVRPADLDTDPFALNFMNGTVDLRTGELRDHRRADFITKLVRYNCNPAATCPRWLAFLAQVMGGGPNAWEADLDRARRLVAYLRRALGYSLTGTTSEKTVFIPFGTGDNGKSTMLSTFRHLIEEYSVLLQVDTLMVRQESNNTQADLADLRGARFVQTSETEEGQRLAQGKLKRITQGMGKIKATRKYENPIEFPETHKLWMDTNRKPTIRDVDDKATFNRLHPIPFTVTIPKENIDRELPDKLLGEAEGILAWAVEGAGLWYAEGLGKPAEVEAAKEQWREDMDQLGRFIDERCVVGDGFRGRASALYSDYKQWATDGGERTPLTSTSFGTKLMDRGFSKSHSERGAVYFGIGLRSAEEQQRG